MLITGTIIKLLIRTVSKKKEIYTRLIIGVLIYATIITYKTTIIIQDTQILGGMFHRNNLINGMEMYIYILSIIAILLIREEIVAEYRIILGFSILGMITLIESYDIIATFLAIELQSLSMYVIATISRKESTAAGLKYFLLGSLASAILLLGLVIIYSRTGITQYDSLKIIVKIVEKSEGWIKGGITLITIGLLFKIGAAPFHSWAPDVYDNVPTIVTSWLAIMGKISILIYILNGEIIRYTSIIIISAILCLIIGGIVGLVQNRIKRLLAYSSISHIGYMLIGLSIDNGLAVSSFIFYMLQYWVGLISIFAIIIKYKIESINSLKILRRNPAIVFSIIISFFSLTGIPPLIGFFGKQLILYSSLLNGYYLISTIAICTSVISAAYYLRIVKTISFNIKGEKSKEILLENNGMNSWIISIITLINLLFFINPNIILRVTHGLAILNI
jgi:NADH-ubiquinone oxidoreductase chain 2